MYFQYLRGLTVDFKTNPKRYWPFLKCVTNKSSISPVFRASDGNTVTGDQGRAELLNDAFAMSFTQPNVRIRVRVRVRVRIIAECADELVTPVTTHLSARVSFRRDGSRQTSFPFSKRRQKGSIQLSVSVPAPSLRKDTRTLSLRPTVSACFSGPVQ